jgi:tetratricopeptide (TPR) repeat protein
MAKGASAALVARHLGRGGAPEQAAVLFLEAAAAARINFQSKLAIRHYQRALSLLPHGDSRRLIAHEALENIYRTLGRRRERRRHLLALRALARELRQPKWVALSLTRTARLDLDEGLLARGLPLAQTAETVARAAIVSAIEVESQSILSGLLRELGDIQGALAACDRALETAAARPDVPPRARAEVLQARGILLRRLGRVREAVDSFAEAIAVFRRTGARRQEARAKNSLAFAMFLLERFEDAIALALASIRIDLAIGGRFQVAKTLTTIGRCYARLGDVPRSLAYLKRAREAHEHYRDQDSRAETLLASAEVLIEAGDLDAAHVFCGDAAALNAVTGNAYDSVYERIVRAQLSRAAGDGRSAAAFALEARRAAETQALLSFNLIATAVEAIARVETGEAYPGVLLASNALGAVDEVQGTEYGLAIRALCADALTRAGSPQADAARKRAAAHAQTIANAIRDTRLKEFFLARPMVAELLGEEETGAPPSEGPASAQGSTA